ncbi:hypothetical protein BpHYR1_018764, partial [Brachionus plicatilis]
METPSSSVVNLYCKPVFKTSLDIVGPAAGTRGHIKRVRPQSFTFQEINDYHKSCLAGGICCQTALLKRILYNILF